MLDNVIYSASLLKATYLFGVMNVLPISAIIDPNLFDLLELNSYIGQNRIICCYFHGSPNSTISSDLTATSSFNLSIPTPISFNHVSSRNTPKSAGKKSHYKKPSPKKARVVFSDFRSEPKPSGDATNYTSLKVKEPRSNPTIAKNALPTDYVSIETKGEKATSSSYLTVVVGASIAKIGELQSDMTAGILNGYDQYLPNYNYDTAVLFGVGGGYEFKVGSDGLLSLGVGIYRSSNYTGKGQVWYNEDYSGYHYTQHKFNYVYNVESTRFMVETQLAWQFKLRGTNKLVPFILFGIGSSSNFINSYEETLVDPKAAIGQGFKSNHSINFAYQLGAGIAYQANVDNDRLFIAYRNVDLGRAQFNKCGYSSENNFSSYQLDAGRVRANEIYIGYTHLLNL